MTSADPSRPTLVRVLLTFFLSLILVLGMGATAANAWDIGGDHGANPGGGGQPGGGGGGSGGGAGSGGGGGGGGGTTPTRKYYSINRWAEDGWSVTGCGTDTYGRPAIGVTYRYSYPASMSVAEVAEILAFYPNPSTQGVHRVGDRCHYLPSYTDYRITCVLTNQVNLAQVQPVRRTLDNKSERTAFADNRTLANCERSDTHLSVGASVEDFGRYTFTGSATKMACQKRVYTSAHPRTGVTPAPELINCGSSYVDPAPEKRWELTCAGFREGWSRGNPSWTLDDCLPTGSSSPIFQCTAPGSNTVNGAKTNTAILFRSGENNRVVYGKSEPRGKGITVNSVRTTVLREKGGTPWATAPGAYRTAGPGNKEFRIERNGSSMLTSETKTRSVNGYAQQWDLSAVWASDAGKPTITKAQYFHNVTLRMTSVRVTGYNTDTGAISTTPITINVDTTATCYSNPLSTEFVRAVND